MAGAFLYENLIAGAATVTAADTAADAGVSNLLDPQPRRRMRVALDPASASILVDFGALKACDCVAVISTNCTASALVRVRLSTSDPAGLAGDIWDTGLVAADTGPAANGNIIVNPGTFTPLYVGRYLLVQVSDGTQPYMDIGILAAGQMWRLSRAQSYGFRDGRLMLDQRERNPLTGAEFPVPSLFNPRFAAFQVQNLSGIEVRVQERAMLRNLGAVKDALWIPDVALSRSEQNLRSIWGAAAQPGDDAGAERVNFIGWSRAWRLIERG